VASSQTPAFISTTQTLSHRIVHLTWLSIRRQI